MCEIKLPIRNIFLILTSAIVIFSWSLELWNLWKLLGYFNHEAVSNYISSTPACYQLKNSNLQIIYVKQFDDINISIINFIYVAIYAIKYKVKVYRMTHLTQLKIVQVIATKVLTIPKAILQCFIQNRKFI